MPQFVGSLSWGELFCWGLASETRRPRQDLSATHSACVHGTEAATTFDASACYAAFLHHVCGGRGRWDSGPLWMAKIHFEISYAFTSIKIQILSTSNSDRKTPEYMRLNL